ncbi:MAG: DUF1273 domain-containing protein [Firmicutes bacterium]|nr:DUF1273 domain-containing protein [Bacillota bacterium]
MTVCTFAGHREVYQANIADKLDEAISRIIKNDDCFRFLVGGMGDFDGMCSSAVRRAKRNYPNKQISLELILPYLTQELNENKSYYEISYDDVVVPIELAGVHYKSAITKMDSFPFLYTQSHKAFS